MRRENDFGCKRLTVQDYSEAISDGVSIGFRAEQFHERGASMKTILVLAQHPELGESIRAALNPEHYRIVHRLSVEEADPLLNHSLLDVCVIDADLTNVQALWMI